MSEKSDFEAIPVGLALGTMEMTLDENTVNERAGLVQWEVRELVDKLHIAPPGISIHQHPRMRFAKKPYRRIHL